MYKIMNERTNMRIVWQFCIDYYNDHSTYRPIFQNSINSANPGSGSHVSAQPLVLIKLMMIIYSTIYTQAAENFELKVYLNPGLS